MPLEIQNIESASLSLFAVETHAENVGSTILIIVSILVLNSYST